MNDIYLRAAFNSESQAASKTDTNYEKNFTFIIHANHHCMDR